MALVSQPIVEDDERLVIELHRLGIGHLARLKTSPEHSPIPPERLIAALAAHSEARLNGALVLLFLRQPAYHQYLPEVMELLNAQDAITLRLYYQAAVYLQRELAPGLGERLAQYSTLPDLFSKTQGLPPADTIAPGHLTAQPALNVLGEQHQRHSGRRYNWSGSYRQHIGWLFKHLGPNHT